ncbi:leucine-rich repeat domain-containing protein [Zarconia navalis]|uniref:leucine-rich repeat domain-containing protein n=1 Tax=Zarconia navalis TaxID=2992134 RepID=UPI0021F83452|nr:leucine-rich repeat domain-containing protein [Zarconia navalis]
MTSNTTQSRKLGWKKGAVALISLSMVISGSPVAAQEEFDRFADWCENRSTLTPEAQHTVEVLLEEVETQDCQSAEERLTNLESLILVGNQIVDVTPLSSLTNLDTLDLGANQIEDITPLSSLTNLTWLFLYGNQLVDVTPLSSLTNLSLLALGGNQIEDVTPLSSLTNLGLLDLVDNQIEDVAPLSSLTNLYALDLGGNQIVDRTCPVEPTSVCDFEKPDLPLPGVKSNR